MPRKKSTWKIPGFLFFCFVERQGLLCSSGSPWTHYIAKTGTELASDTLASASHMLGLQEVWAGTPGLRITVFILWIEVSLSNWPPYWILFKEGRNVHAFLPQLQVCLYVIDCLDFLQVKLILVQGFSALALLAFSWTLFCYGVGAVLCLTWCLAASLAFNL